MKKVSIDKKFFPFIFALACLLLYHLFFNDSYFDIFSYLHWFGILFASVLLNDRDFDLKKLINIVKIITILNLIFLFSYFTLFKDVFFTENLGFYRYRSFLPEPAMAAFFTIFNIVILSKIKKSNIWIFFNIVITFFTFSGTAYMMGTMLLIVYFLSSLSIKRILYLGLIIVILFSTISMFLTDSIILDRVSSFMNADFDTSTLLRFAAPFELFHMLSNNLDSFLFGVGNPSLYIDKNFHELHYFYLFDGSKTNNLNNAFVGLFSYGGISIFLVLFLVFIDIGKSKFMTLTMYLLILPFFSGHLISLYLWTFIYIYKMVIYEQKEKLCSLTR
jgi:hypothetical protein